MEQISENYVLTYLQLLNLQLICSHNRCIKGAHFSFSTLFKICLVGAYLYIRKMHKLSYGYTFYIITKPLL